MSCNLKASVSASFCPESPFQQLSKVQYTQHTIQQGAAATRSVTYCAWMMQLCKPCMKNMVLKSWLNKLQPHGLLGGF